LKLNIIGLNLKSLSGTRWESRTQAVRAPRLLLNEVIKSLNDIIEDNSRDMKTEHRLIHC
jgi:hypothetical protein